MSEQKRKTQALNSHEQAALLREPNRKAPTGLRNLCLISLMLKAGLRVSEAIVLAESDIDWQEGRVTLRASGGAGARSLWLDDTDLKLLCRWKSIRPKSSPYLFCTLKGNHLKDRYVREMVKRVGRKAGLEKDIFPHLLRFTFAHDFIRDSGDPVLLQKALGHRDQSATRAYLKKMALPGNITYNGSEGGRRSGIPAEEQVLKKGTVEKPASGEKPAGQAVREALITQKSEGTISYKSQREKGAAVRAGYLQARKERPEPSETGDNFSVNITTEGGGSKQLKIPAMKCSNCNYILRFQGDCPQCATAFNDILRHWGRRI